MKIAILGNPDSVHVRRWTRFLAARGHELLLIADPHTTARPPEARVEVAQWSLPAKILAFRLTPRPHGNALWKHLAYRPLLREFRPDVVHGFEAHYSGPAVARAGPFAKVLTPWGKDVHADAFRGPIWNRVVRMGLAGAHRISTNDPTMPEYLNAAFGVAREKVRAFSWGVDPTIFRPGPPDEGAARRRALAIDADAPVVFSPRRFDPYWGADRIVDAIAPVVAAVPGTVFVFAAGERDADFHRRATERIAREGLASSVRLVEEKLSPAEMAATFRAADAFVSIPRTDLLATTVLEGLACGCAPILADLPAYRIHAPLATPGGRPNARTVPPDGDAGSLAAATIDVLRDPEGSAAASEFNVERMLRLEDERANMAEMETVYREAIEASESSRKRL